MSRPALIAALLLVSIAAESRSESDLSPAMREVERIRNLTFLSDVKHVSIDRKELPSRLREQVVKSLPYSAEDFELILRTLFLVDPSRRDVIPSLLELYQGQVLAYYDPLTSTYYSLRQLPEATKALGDVAMVEQSVMVHELTHALQDQRFAIARRDLALRDDWDASLAYHSLLEGEATLVMMASVLQNLGQSLDDVVGNEALLGLLSSTALQDPSMVGDAPAYFVESLKFPYLEGMRFVIAAYRRGGWSELDRIHRDPPASTREILHPEEYFRKHEHAAPVVHRSPVGAGHLLTVEHFGEFTWSFLLGADAARGWTDDRVAIVQDAWCEPTVLVETRWETPERARVFRSAYENFLRTRGVLADSSLHGTIARVAYGADQKAIEEFIQ